MDVPEGKENQLVGRSLECPYSGLSELVDFAEEAPRRIVDILVGFDDRRWGACEARCQRQTDCTCKLNTTELAAAGEFALTTGQFEAFAAGVNRAMSHGVKILVPFQKRRLVLWKGAEKVLQELLFQARYPVRPEINDCGGLLDAVDVRADNIELDLPAFRRLFSVRRDRSLDWEDWSQRVRWGYSFETLVSDFVNLRTLFVDLLPDSELEVVRRRLSCETACVFLTSHSGLLSLRLHLCQVLAPGALFIIASNELPSHVTAELNSRWIALHKDGSNAKEVLHAAIKELISGRSVWIAPDGCFAEKLEAVEVMGRKYEIGVGAALMAFESESPIVWVDVQKMGAKFVPSLVFGPRRMAGERYLNYKDRFLSFYGEMLDSQMTGNPETMVLNRRLLRRPKLRES